jgi:hypothetical protein
MDFKLSSGTGKSGKCPKCGRKYLAMIRAGIKQFVCSCGWKQEMKQYPQNSINSEQLYKS